MPAQEESVVWMRAVVVILLLLTSACTASESATTTSVPPTTDTSVAPTTTAVSTTTTVDPTSSTSTTVSNGQVGSREVMLDEMRAAWEANQFTYDWAFEDAYIPDLQNPDPLIALREVIEFNVWLDAAGGNQLWWDVFTVPNSPAFDFWRNVLSRTPGFLYVEDADGHAFRIAETREATEAERSEVPTDVLSAAPPTSVVLIYSGSDPDGGLIVFAPTGELDGTFQPYDVDARIVVLSPSDSGWAFYWGNWR